MVWGVSWKGCRGAELAAACVWRGETSNTAGTLLR